MITFGKTHPSLMIKDLSSALTIRVWPPLLPAVIGLLVLASAPSQAQVLVNYTFESLTNGALVGQDGWTAGGTTSPVIANGPVGSVDTTKVAANATTTGVAVAKKTFFGAGSLSSSSIVTLQVDVSRAPGGSNISGFGIGSSSGMSAYFGIAGNTFIIRNEAYGATFNATNLTANIGDWYTVQSVWDLSTGTGSLFVKNLTAGQTSFTQLTFGAQSTVTLGLTTAVDTWTTAYVRLAESGASASYLDNISAVAVPEPATISLLLGLGFFVILLRRKNH